MALRQPRVAPPVRTEQRDQDRLERGPGLAGAPGSRGGVLRQQSLEPVREPCVDVRDARDRVVDVAQQDRDRGAGVVEGRVAREQRVGQAADRVEVRPRPDLAGQRVLGGHVGGLRHGQRRRGRSAEVDDLDAPVVADAHVLGHQDAARVAERGQDDFEHTADLGQAQPPEVRT
jgi:hypothetical protein